MIYPSFLKKGDKIALTALSSGCKDSLDELKISVTNLEKDYDVTITNDVYGNEIVSDTKEIRAYEFNNLLDNDFKMIYIARGGDYLIETLPLIDYNKLKSNPVWIQGYSDPTSLLYIITTKYDIATIYGLNGKGYDNLILEPYQLVNLEYNKGNLIKQESYMDRNTVSLNGDFDSEGVIIGGCIDVLKDLINTEYDNTINFIERYKDKNIIWYFDIFALSSLELMNTLSLFKENSWFKYSNTFLFSSVMFPNLVNDLSYIDAIKRVLDDDNYNIIFDANIGHIKPSFTIINGSLASVRFKNNKLELEQKLMEE